MKRKDLGCFKDGYGLGKEGYGLGKKLWMVMINQPIGFSF